MTVQADINLLCQLATSTLTYDHVSAPPDSWQPLDIRLAHYNGATCFIHR
jgi:hypothetical protein